MRGSKQVGEVPNTYRCFKCQKKGHWIKNCPLKKQHGTPHTKNKRGTGIPRSFIDVMRLAGNSPATKPINLPPVEKEQEIPDDLICGICKDIFTDAVMIACCGSSFCDDCARTALLESEDNECPECSEKGSLPGSLIPNRFLRNSVNSFKNETGYNKPRQPKKTASKENEASPENGESPTNTERNKEQGNTPRDGDQPHAEKPHDESDYRDRQNATNENKTQSHLYDDERTHGGHDAMSKLHGNEMNMRYGMQSHSQQQPLRQQNPQMLQQPMSHRPTPPSQIPLWWNQQNRYGYTMPGMHQNDGIKPNESGMYSHPQMGQMHYRGYAQHQPPPQMHQRPVHQGKSASAASARKIRSYSEVDAILDTMESNFKNAERETQRMKDDIGQHLQNRLDEMNDAKHALKEAMAEKSDLERDYVDLKKQLKDEKTRFDAEKMALVQKIAALEAIAALDRQEKASFEHKIAALELKKTEVNCAHCRVALKPVMFCSSQCGKKHLANCQ